MIWAALERPWQVCLEEAWTAYRAGSIPIGAAITDAAGVIAACGRNRIYEREAEERHLHGHRLAHAEMNALNALDYRAVDPRACTLYTTTEPCPLCTGAIRMTKIGVVRYAARDTAAGSTALLEATPFMRRGGVRVVGPERADLEAIITAMHVEFSLCDGVLDRSAYLFDCWEPIIPDGVALGRNLHTSGELRRLGAMDAPIATVIDRLAELLPSDTAGQASGQTI
jgi:tRNA(adenine34) deaminase